MMDMNHNPAITWTYIGKMKWVTIICMGVSKLLILRLTIRNFLISLPDESSRRTVTPRLNWILNADAISRMHFSGITTSGIWGGDLIKWTQQGNWHQKKSNKHRKTIVRQRIEIPYLFMKVEALDQRKSMARARIDKWKTRVIRWYSSNSNRIQIAVATPTTAPETFLFLHRRTSAAVNKT